jgi:hypothetical protein
MRVLFFFITLLIVFSLRLDHIIKPKKSFFVKIGRTNYAVEYCRIEEGTLFYRLRQTEIQAICKSCECHGKIIEVEEE